MGCPPRLTSGSTIELFPIQQSRKSPRFINSLDLPIPMGTAVKLNLMIAVNEVTMRFGSRILFEDVTTTFMEGAATPSPALTAPVNPLL